MLVFIDVWLVCLFDVVGWMDVQTRPEMANVPLPMSEIAKDCNRKLHGNFIMNLKNQHHDNDSHVDGGPIITKEVLRRMASEAFIRSQQQQQPPPPSEGGGGGGAHADQQDEEVRSSSNNGRSPSTSPSDEPPSSKSCHVMSCYVVGSCWSSHKNNPWIGLVDSSL